MHDIYTRRKELPSLVKLRNRNNFIICQTSNPFSVNKTGKLAISFSVRDHH